MRANGTYNIYIVLRIVGMWILLQVDEPLVLIQIQSVQAVISSSGRREITPVVSGESQTVSFVIVGGNEEQLFDVIATGDSNNESNSSGMDDRQLLSRGNSTGMQ